MSEIDKSTCMRCRMTFLVGKPPMHRREYKHAEIARCPEPKCGRTFWSGKFAPGGGPVRCYVEHA